jgi:hypothetical protein
MSERGHHAHLVVEATTAGGEQRDGGGAERASEEYGKFGIYLVLVMWHALDDGTFGFCARQNIEIDRVHVAHHVGDAESESERNLESGICRHDEVVDRQVCR